MVKYAYLLVLAAGCGFSGSSAPPDGGDPIPDGGVPGMLKFDSAADFAAMGSIAYDMTIEARGSLTPAAYTYGGLVAHGLQGMALWTHADTSWAKLESMTPTGVALWH